MAAPDAAATRSHGVREDSDIIVALIRTAFLLAFYFVYTTNYVVRGHGVPLYTVVALWAAASFNIYLLFLYLRGYGLRRQRPASLVLDLCLITSAIATLRAPNAVSFPALASADELFELYYLVVIAAAVWYRLVGSASVAVLAIALSIYVPVFTHTLSMEQALEAVLPANAPLLMLVAFIAGYLMRAREAEHASIVEMREEMRVARLLQSGMLPAALPLVEGYDLGLVFTPAGQVGGDFYDVRCPDPDHLLIVLADMSGKSVYGLVHLSLVYSHLQAALHEGCSPAAAAAQVNDGTYEALQPESYAALFIGRLRLSDGLLTFVNCGHVPPLLLPGDGATEAAQLSTGGPVIGAMREPRYVERQVKLAPGDVLLCFSDGVSDARNARKEFFGEKRVAELARQHAQVTAQEMTDAVVAAAQRHAQRPGQDDITVIALRRAAAPGGGQGDWLCQYQARHPAASSEIASSGTPGSRRTRAPESAPRG
jgi:serine phosphatase RsbU (regulator of sigma subunit)